MGILKKHTDEYILTYQIKTSLQHNVHPSWCKLCEAHTKDDVIKILKKHLYDPGKYVLNFSAYNGPILSKTNQYTFSGWITFKSDRGILSAGPIQFDFYEDSFDLCDFKHNWPVIDCEEELASPSARFTVVGEQLTPSPKEFEIICEKSTQKFLKRLHNSVAFPLEITCDYPDVIFEICYDQAPDEELKAKTLGIIENYAKKYNKTHDEGIHHVAEVSSLLKEKDKKENAVYVHVDFGNCYIEVLASVLKALGKSDLAIKEVTLK